MHRRTLLQIGSLGLTGITLPRAMRAAAAERTAPRAKACILLYMDGGPSHIDLFDLKPAAPAEIRGPFQPIASSVPGLSVGELLPRLARQMHHVLEVRSVRHEETVHDPAVYQMLTGYKHISSAGNLQVEPTDLPHMACAFRRADESPAVMPKALQLPDTMKMGARVLPGQSAGVLGATFDPFPLHVTPDGIVIPPDFTRQHDVSIERLRGRSALLRQFQRERESLDRAVATGRFDAFQQQALEIVGRPSVQRAFDLDQEPPELRDLYGPHRHGRSVLLARRLVEAGARFVTVYWGSEVQDWADGKTPQVANNPWDTHRNHFPLVKGSLVPRADQALAALLSDLADRGLLEETLVVWMGDFGRTPRISRPWASRDHWPHAFTVLLAGAGIKAGAVYGRTDNQAAHVTENPVRPADLTATIFDALGVSPAASVPTAEGGSHRLSTGRPMREWFA